MHIEDFKELFDLNNEYSILEIKEILLNNGINEEQIVVKNYDIFVKNAYKNQLLCIHLSLPTINDLYNIKNIYFVPIAIHLADINNPHEYYIRS